MRSHRKYIFLLLVTMIAVVLFVSLCQMKNTHRSTALSTQGPAVKQETTFYLGQIWPVPSSSITSDWYNKAIMHDFLTVGETGIGVVLLPHEIAEEGDFEVNWIARCTLIVNGKIIDNEHTLVENGAVLTEGKNAQGQVLYRVSGPYYVAWRVPLAPGIHQVKLSVQKSSGKILEHSWQFTILP